jgi:accessory gene regulator B
MFKSLSYKFANILVNNVIIDNNDFEIHRYISTIILMYSLINLIFQL